MFRYFGFGSNLNLTSLRAKDVEPLSARPAVLSGWRLRFNVQHFFRHEGGVANIEHTQNPNDKVLGIIYDCADESLELLDAAEAYGYGYDRISVNVEAEGKYLSALTYIGMPEFIDESCLPCRRYLNLLIDGAEQAMLDSDYVSSLRNHPIHELDHYPDFVPPEGNYPLFDFTSLAQKPLYTALFGSVFDMSEARPLHEYLKRFFGGRDMTLFHIKRLDSSNGNETMDDIRYGSLNEAQRRYLNAYLNEYAREYRYVGRINYDED